MKRMRTIEKQCFAACTTALRWLTIEVTTARRTPVSESSTFEFLTAGSPCLDRSWFDFPNEVSRPVFDSYLVAHFKRFNALRNFSRESSAAPNSN